MIRRSESPSPSEEFDKALLFQESHSVAAALKALVTEHAHHHHPAFENIFLPSSAPLAVTIAIV